MSLFIYKPNTTQYHFFALQKEKLLQSVANAP